MSDLDALYHLGTRFAAATFRVDQIGLLDDIQQSVGAPDALYDPQRVLNTYGSSGQRISSSTTAKLANRHVDNTRGEFGLRTPLDRWSALREHIMIGMYRSHGVIATTSF